MRGHRRNRSTSSASTVNASKQTTARSDASGAGIRVEPRVARGSSVLDSVSSRFHDISTFVTRHVQASVGSRSGSPSLMVGSYPQTYHQHRQQMPAQPHYGYLPARSASGSRMQRGLWHGDMRYHAASGTALPAVMHGPGGHGSVNGSMHYGPPVYSVPYEQSLDGTETVRTLAAPVSGRRVLRARFQTLDRVAPIALVDATAAQPGANADAWHGLDWRRRTVLLMGYADGFHIWDVSNVNEIRELASIRDTVNHVVDLQMVPDPAPNATMSTIGEKSPGTDGSTRTAADAFADLRPLVALVSAPPPVVPGDLATEYGWEGHVQSEMMRGMGMPFDDMLQQERASLVLYSLKTHRIVREIGDPHASVAAVACNRHAIVITLSDGKIRVLSTLDLSPVATYTDAMITEECPAPLITLGSRWLAYASTTPPPPAFAGVPRTVDSDESSTMEKVAREVMHGVKSLGSLGYKAMSDYLSSRSSPSNESHMASASSIGRQRSRRSSTSVREPGGVIMIRDLMAEIERAGQQQAEEQSTGHGLALAQDATTSDAAGGLVDARENGHYEVMSSIDKQDIPVTTAMVQGGRIDMGAGVDIDDLDLSINGDHVASIAEILQNETAMTTQHLPPVVHFRAHEHPCSALSFDQSGFRLVTVSSRGDTFRVHQVARGRAELMLTLSRGYTQAVLSDMTFDYESRWLAASTGRGTTHIFRLPSMEAQLRIPSTGAAAGWAQRRAAAERSWPPVVRIRQRPDDDQDSEDAAHEPALTCPPTPNTMYSLRHRSVSNFHGSSAPGDVASVWANAATGLGGPGDTDAHHAPPPPLAARFTHFGPDRDQAVFIVNGSGAMTLHRLRHSKGSELSMESDDVAEWRLLRGEDWETVCQPIQFVAPTPMATTSSASSSEEGEAETALSSAASTVSTPESTPSELQATPPKAEKGAGGRKSKRRSKANVSIPATDVPSSDPSVAESPAPVPSSKLAANTSETKWLSHAELVTYPPNLARSLWNETGFQFQVFDRHASGDGGDLSAVRIVDVNHPLPTPYGWARAENDGVAASSANLEECIRKAMQTGMDLSPASRELLGTHSRADPYTRSDRNSPPALMQHHFDDDDEIQDIIRRQGSLPASARRSPLLTPEDLDQDALDDFDLYSHQTYPVSGTTSGVDCLSDDTTEWTQQPTSAAITTNSNNGNNNNNNNNNTDEWQDAGHLRIPSGRSRASKNKQRQQKKQQQRQQAGLAASTTANAQSIALPKSTNQSRVSSTSDTSIALIADEVREISLSDDEEAKGAKASGATGNSPSASSRLLGSIRWFDDS